MRTPDEPSRNWNIGNLSIVLWLGPLRDWRLGLADHRYSQNPHWQFYLGFISFVWWTY